MKALNKVIDVIYELCVNIGAVILGAIMIVITLGITSRYVLKNPYTWTEEIAIILMIYLCYVSSAVTTVEKKHAIADFFIEKASSKFKTFLSYASRVLSAAFLCVIAYSAIKIIPQLNFRSPVLRISRSVYYFPVIVMSLYMVLAIIVDVVDDIVGYDGPRPGMKKKEQKDEAAAEKKDAEQLMDAVDSLLGKVNHYNQEEK